MSVIRTSGVRVINKGVTEPLGLGFITENGTSHVTTCVPGGPAWNADICVGDRLVNVNGSDLTPLDHDDILDLFKSGGSTIEVIVAIPTTAMRRSGPRTIKKNPTQSLGQSLLHLLSLSLV